MKSLLLRSIFYTLGAFLIPVIHASGQSWYSTSGGELILSTARGKVNGQSIEGPLRFSAFLHTNSWYHYDFSDNIGFCTGWGLKNIGFIHEANGLRTKFRSYALSVPVGIKLGKLSQDSYFQLGGGVDLLFNYKEKTFRGSERIRRITGWFSNRTELLAPYLYAGYQFPYGLYIRGYYYWSNFLNTSFTTNVNGIETRPYAETVTHLVYVSVGFNIRNKKALATFRPHKR
jgi:hypothetical protein